MARRSAATLTDYLLIGINPALVMLMLGGLVGFLLEAFYRGEFDARLRFIFAMYVMGSVAIARISIEEGRGRASLFALPLAVVTALALGRFVTYAGPLSGLAMPLNCGILALVWWSADRLTRDCTVIDEASHTPATGLWQALRQRRKDSGLAGLWIVYFALAALPLFGFGQWFLPDGDDLSQSRAFWFLALYLASALSLLASTSFLNLRKYLRQRGVDVPASMTLRWLVWGGGSIVTLLLLTALLPRPQGWNSPSEIAFSPRDLKVSRWGWGTEGVHEKGQSGSGQSGSGQSGSGQSGSGQSGSGQSGSGQSGSGQSGSGQSGSGQSGSGQSGSGQSGSGQSGSGQSGSGQSGSGQSGSGQSGSSQSGSGQSGSGQSEAASSQTNSTQPGQTQPGLTQPGQTQSGNAQEGQSASARSESAASSNGASGGSLPNWSALGAVLGGFLRLVFFIGTLILLAWFAWRSRAELLEAWRQLRREWQAFWARLRGSPTTNTERVSEGSSPPLAELRFADFADPFVSGMAQRVSSGELVAYSFAALEAWGRERGCPRLADQTPLEFAQVLGTHQTGFAAEVLAVADLYCQHAYAGGSLPATAGHSLRRLWQRLNA